MGQGKMGRTQDLGGDAATPRDIPVIMSRPMVRATIEDRKTETRRFAWLEEKVGEQRKPSVWQRVKPGDRLYIRENRRPDDYAPEDKARTIFMADAPEQALRETCGVIRWRPAIHLPRNRTRLTLIVNAVKIEPLWNISERDCEAEGVVLEPADPPFWYVPGILPHDITFVGVEERADRMPHAVQSFRKLWIHLHGREGWDANPEVVAISFRVIKANIDAPEARIAA
jgi:hypothetical protein